jgi:hypothetical protein
MDSTDLINDNFFSVLLKYDFIIVLGICVGYFIFCVFTQKTFSNITRIAYFLGIICLIASSLHLIYDYLFINDTDNSSASTIVYTSNMYVILTIEAASFIAFGLLFIIGLFVGNNNQIVVKKNNSFKSNKNNSVVKKNNSFKAIVPST